MFKRKKLIKRKRRKILKKKRKKRKRKRKKKKFSRNKLKMMMMMAGLLFQKNQKEGDLFKKMIDNYFDIIKGIFS